MSLCMCEVATANDSLKFVRKTRLARHTRHVRVQSHGVRESFLIIRRARPTAVRSGEKKLCFALSRSACTQKSLVAAAK